MSEVYGYRGHYEAEEAFEQQQEVNEAMRLQLRARIMKLVTEHHDAAWHLRHRQREQVLKGDQE